MVGEEEEVGKEEGEELIVEDGEVQQVRMNNSTA